MKKYHFLSIVIGSMVVLLLSFTNPSHHTAANPLSYEKFGNIAIAVVKADYPEQPVTDYEYLGRKKISAMEEQDSFRFIVKENGKEKVIEVKVNHHTKDDKFLSLHVEEAKKQP
ncbi:MAG TPA: DUF3889 domain-containing protein [Niallia sp.]|nr:DUF3889 domain-containing protein [Niallia sp.]